MTYDVYFGTNTTPPFGATIGPYPAAQSSITCDPGILAPNTEYYWKIVARDNHGIAREGPVWTFTTVALGDANGDGAVNVLDLAFTARIIAGLEPNGDLHPGADANQDGMVNVLDLAQIARIIAGLA